MPDGNQYDRAGRPGREQQRAQTAADIAVDKLQRALGPLADVRHPKDADAPILAKPVRAALLQWLREISSREELAAVGVEPRSTAVLFGPPGTGKTTLAHHLAARLGIPMLVVGPENIIDKYLGESAKKAARLFAAIKECGMPCMLFMDEIDALGASREGNGDACSREITSTLTVIMRKVEEFDGFLVAATNRKDDIDPALWRRFHIQLPVDLPAYEERFAIIRRYSLPFEMDDADVGLLAGMTDMASPALLKNLMEGMKRSLIVYPKMGLSINDAKSLFMSVISSITPPPQLTKPPLWENPSLASSFDAFEVWPPPLPGRDDQGQ